MTAKRLFYGGLINSINPFVSPITMAPGKHKLAELAHPRCHSRSVKLRSEGQADEQSRYQRRCGLCNAAGQPSSNVMLLMKSLLPAFAEQDGLMAELHFVACTGAFGLFRTAYHEGGDNMRLLLDNTLPDELAPVTGIKQPFESEPHLLARQHMPLPRASHKEEGGGRARTYGRLLTRAAC